MLKNIGSLSWCETEHINEKGKKVYKGIIVIKNTTYVTTFFIDSNLQIIYKTSFRARWYNLWPTQQMFQVAF